MASTRKLTKINKRHAGLLRAGEQIQTTLNAQQPTQPQPSAVWLGFGLVGALIGHAVDKTKVPQRVADLEAQFGHLTPMPDSKNGYQLAMTDQRMLVFDGPGKHVLVQVPRTDLQLRLCTHANGMHSVVLSDAVASFAVTANRHESRAAVDEFVASAGQTVRF